jgi:hypothetical protein
MQLFSPDSKMMAIFQFILFILFKRIIISNIILLRRINEQLIQVCADFDAPDVCQREVRGLSSAAEEYPAATLHLIALTAPASPRLPKNIRLHLAADWLLQE